MTPDDAIHHARCPVTVIPDRTVGPQTPVPAAVAAG
jgi:hypothetical protein